MSGRTIRGTLLGVLVVVAATLVAAAALFAPSAQASVTPSLSLDQSGGTQAGATQNLGMHLQFSNSLTDSPDAMTINLPPGLLANAAINGGACLKTYDISDTRCQVGTGTVTADALVDLNVGSINLVPLTVDVSFDLVPPPAPGDLAGLVVNMDQTQIGQTAGIRIRPSGDPDGVGVTLDFVLPNTLSGAPIEITDINSTFDGLRYPATCPSTPARVSVSVDSYQDTTVHTVSAPLRVTGCSKLPYAPKLAVRAAKDSSDRQVSLTTSVTQAADEAPTRSLTLAFPGSALGVNLAAVRLICGSVTSGTCTPVGTATAISPFYPAPLTANAYLTGTALGPTLTLVFPPPFPLTLVGNVTLTTKTASFSGLPDIPLTSLALNLNGGANGMFLTNCNPGDGTADGTSTDQNGDRTKSAAVSYQISGCAASSYTSSGINSPADVTAPAAAGLSTGHPSLRFRVTERRRAARLTALTIELPHGLRFVRHRAGGHMRVTGVSLSGARIRSCTIVRGRLVIRLRRPSAAVGVRLTSVLRESPGLISTARSGRIRGLHLTVIALNTAHRRHTSVRPIRL